MIPIIYKDKDEMFFFIFPFASLEKLLVGKKAVTKKSGSTQITIFGKSIMEIDVFEAVLLMEKEKLSFIKEDSLLLCTKDRKHVLVPAINVKKQFFEERGFTYYFEARDLSSYGKNLLAFNVPKYNLLHLKEVGGQIKTRLNYNDFVSVISFKDNLLVVDSVTDYLNAIYYYKAQDISSFILKTVEGLINDGISNAARHLLQERIDLFPTPSFEPKSRHTYDKYKEYLKLVKTWVVGTEFELNKSKITDFSQAWFERLYMSIESTQYFFRGVGLPVFSELPAALRKRRPNDSFESAMFFDFALQFPRELDGLSSLEKLAEMQHSGLPTRLLDITLNPLVALYMACNSLFNSRSCDNKYGEVIVYPARETVYVLNSDPTLLVASLSILSDEEKRFLAEETERSVPGKTESQKMKEIKKKIIDFGLQRESPGDFDAKLLRRSYYVEPGNINERIAAQAGAFILFGLDEKYINQMESSRLSKNRIFVSNKASVLHELAQYNICDATLFPDKDHTAIFIKAKYGY